MASHESPFPSQGKSAGTIERRHARIVAIDDDPLVLELLDRSLSQQGHSVTVMDDPRAAVAAILADPPGLVITDLDMPYLGGRDVIRQIRSALPAERLPIIVLSSVGEEEIILDCFALGASDYLTKPFLALTAKITLLLACPLSPTGRPTRIAP